MNEGLIARRYASALLKFAQERGKADVVYEKMKLFQENYISHPDLHRALLSPVMSAKDKEMLLSTAVGIEPGDLYIRGIRLVIKNHREMYVRAICLMYQKLYRKAYHIGRVHITTAKELDPGIIGKIQKLVSSKTEVQLEFVHKVDPSIIGGFVLRINSMQLDASVSRELKDLKLKLR